MNELSPDFRIRNWVNLAEAMDYFFRLEQREKAAEEWVFRGANDATDKTPLTTTLDQVAQDFGISGEHIATLENDLLLEFMRRYHHYPVEPAPAKGEVLDWLALMRHYGAPTRLLDFTFSLLVAAYFALERRKEKPQGEPTVWAISKTWLSNEVPPIVRKSNDLAEPFDRYLKERDGEGFDKAFLKGRLQFVYPVNPFRMNQRLTIQQGLFLCPGDVTKTFEENLRSLPKNEVNVKQIRIDPNARSELLKAIHRANINRATLFPGLDGFALSLWTKAASLRLLREMEDSGARLTVNLDKDSIRKH